MVVGIVENQAIHRLNVIKSKMMKKEGRDTVDAYCVDGYLVSTPLPREFECERREGEMHRE